MTHDQRSRPTDLVALGDDDRTVLRTAFGHFPSGVVGLCAVVDGTPVGMAASSFTVGVSLEPPLVLFAVQHSSTTWPVLKQAPRIGISVFGDSHAAAVRQLSAKAGDRFAGLDTLTTAEGAVFLHDSAVWFDCAIHSETPAGDHDVIVLEVKALRAELETAPLVWHGSGFRALAG
jgi:flavin reductase (DIM6/NTAB) family NADH-FMN oxidoreductase RutF